MRMRLKSAQVSEGLIFHANKSSSDLDHYPHGGRDARLARCKDLLEAKARGLVRTVGVSNFSEKYIEEIPEALEKPAVNQIEVGNSFTPVWAKQFHPWCQQCLTASQRGSSCTPGSWQ
ncbi:hypothetical protein JVT61DRAFT_13266 [Boletus reticuloceps]|uniref:NADP-dependent oxidoreductase domain-containing protein n=1 Tax=Boletus reticuloceps TaxID=495285 RepID=A0A8I3AD20_9AGAM|nr:hypothetical protein JVT61DRAFT_13266 [Boletus reticuloceps]